MRWKVSIQNIAAFFGCIYLFLSTNPFILWTTMPSVFYLLIFLIIVVVTISLTVVYKIVLTTNRILLVTFLSIFIFFIFLPINGREFLWAQILLFLSLIAIIFYQDSIHYQIFVFFRKFLIFFSIFAIAIFILILIGVDPEAIPHYKVEAFTIPMLRHNDFYRVYGFVVSSTNTIYHFGGLTIARACGPFLEPGHFAIYLGVTVSIEKLLYNKISKILVIAGFITFSPAFLIFLGLIVFYDIFFFRNFKLLIYLSVFVVLVLFIIITSEEIREGIYYLAIERNLGDGIKSTIENRSTGSAYFAYKNLISTKDFLLGKGTEFFEKFGVMSDFRGFIFKYGLIGFILSIGIVSIILTESKINSLFISLPILVLIFAHRSWMFESPYSYLYLLLIIRCYNFYQEQKLNIDDSKS